MAQKILSPIRILQSERGIGVILLTMITATGMAVMFGILQSYISYRASEFKRVKSAYNLTFVLENLARFVYSGYDEANRRAYEVFTTGGGACPPGTHFLRVGPTGRQGCWPNPNNMAAVNAFCGPVIANSGAVIIDQNPNAAQVTWGCFPGQRICITEATSGQDMYCIPVGNVGPGGQPRTLALHEMIQSPSNDIFSRSQRMVADLQFKIFEKLDQVLDRRNPSPHPFLDMAYAQARPFSTAASATVNMAIPSAARARELARFYQDCTAPSRCVAVSLCFDASGTIKNNGPINVAPGGTDQCFTIDINLTPKLEVRGNGALTGNAVCENLNPAIVNEFRCVATTTGGCGGVLGVNDRAYCQINSW